MEVAVVRSKGQIVIPAKIRKKFGIKNGSRIALIEKDEKIIMQPLDKEYFNNLAGILDEKGKMLKSLIDDKKKEKVL